MSNSLFASSFQTFYHTELEDLTGRIFTQAQKECLQNDRARIAESILALTYNPQNPVQFAQDDAHLKGQLASISYILQMSEEAEARFAELTRLGAFTNSSE